MKDNGTCNFCEKPLDCFGLCTDECIKTQKAAAEMVAEEQDLADGIQAKEAADALWEIAS